MIILDGKQEEFYFSLYGITEGDIELYAYDVTDEKERAKNKRLIIWA